MDKGNITTVISLFDLHYPYHIDLSGIYRFIKDIKPDEIVFGGDMIDCQGMSGKFYRGSPEIGLAETVEEIKGFKKIIKKILKLSPQSKLVYLLGNHEHRIVEKLRDSPELGNLIDLQIAYKGLIDERIDYNGYYNVGNLYYTHGTYHNMHFAKQHVDNHGRNIRFGHLHSIQEFSKKTGIDQEFISAKSIPCLCGLNPDYMKNRPSSWSNGFHIAYINKNGTFNDYNIVITKKHFIYNGKKY